MVLKKFRYQYLQTEVEVALLVISATTFVVLVNSKQCRSSSALAAPVLL